jgi:release factor glutamine methyltransferase
LPEAAPVAPPVTVAGALRHGAAELARAGCDSPRLDAELLLAEALGVDRARVVIAAGEPLEPDAAARYATLLARRRAREPVAYILGRRDFRHLTLAVDRRVLIPRPETELLVEVALALPARARVLDVGTGSGAVALALAAERPDLSVWGSDISEDALAVARANAGALGLPVRFAAGDLLDGGPGRLDAVLANLPYVELGAALPPEVAAFEPSGALFGGPDGLDLVRRLIAAAAAAGVPLLGLEIGAGQAEAVDASLRGAGYVTVERHRDLAGIERVLVGRRP